MAAVGFGNFLLGPLGNNGVNIGAGPLNQIRDRFDEPTQEQRQRVIEWMHECGFDDADYNILGASGFGNSSIVVKVACGFRLVFERRDVFGQGNQPVSGILNVMYQHRQQRLMQKIAGDLASLRQEVESLREEVHYAPGGVGMAEAKTHFEQSAGKAEE